MVKGVECLGTSLDELVMGLSEVEIEGVAAVCVRREYQRDARCYGLAQD